MKSSLLYAFLGVLRSDLSFVFPETCCAKLVCADALEFETVYMEINLKTETPRRVCLRLCCR